MNHFMIDIETMGTLPGSVILSIAAAHFSPTTGEIYNSIHVRPDPHDQERQGYRKDFDTIKWWMGQSQEAKTALFCERPIPFYDALYEVKNFFDRTPLQDGGERVWCRGPDFDAAHLNFAYQQQNIPLPWNFWESRCHRTFLETAGIDHKQFTATVAHDALEDVKMQIASFVAANNKIGTFL